ncbi:hypothetical protein AN959_03460 [Psychrobacillus sp. FJAT-21963]|nr:hypothetical protein AN959_03460 [Psychrobacillus sp. FJAT-21963]
MTNLKNQTISNNALELIGKLCDSRFAFFDNRAQEYKYKVRPVLVIGVEKDKLPCDITVLPVSKISREENISALYDYPLTKENHPLLKLKYDPSFVRIHKISTMHSKDLTFYTNSQLNVVYPDTYSEIEDKFKTYTSGLF